VTAIVPVYGPGPHLDRVVAALCREEPPVERIIVSHSGVGDPAPRYAALPSVTVLHSPERLFAGAARNRGLALAETEWVAFIDEDVIVEEGWHAALLKAIADGKADCIAGSVGCAERGGYWGMSLWLSEFSSVNPHLGAGPISSGASANLAMRRPLLVAIGGFREDWLTGEDSLAQAQLEKAGYKLRFAPDLVGRHVNVPGLRHLIRHSHRLGRYSARLRRSFPHLTGASAVRWPVLSLGMWLGRLGQIYLRILTTRKAPIGALVWHTPGVLTALVAWNVGFAKEAFAGSSVEPGR
jgi:GT2 family glycosyltransferase